MTTMDRWKRAYALCLDCDLLHPESTRLRVRQHVSNAGHRARYVVEDTTDYAPTKGRQP